VGNPFWNRYQRDKLKFGAGILIGAIPSAALLIFLNEVLGLNDPWVWYISGSLFYTIAVLVNAYIDDGSVLFTKEDSRSKSKLTLVHLSYLCALFLTIQIAQYLRPRLPPAMLARDPKGGTWAQFALFVAICAFFFVEESWLAAKKK
jgi:hypothetical protein